MDSGINTGGRYSGKSVQNILNTRKDSDTFTIPFENKPTDTPMTSIATTIEINMKQLLIEREIPKPIEPTDFYPL